MKIRKDYVVMLAIITLSFVGVLLYVFSVTVAKDSELKSVKVAEMNKEQAYAIVHHAENKSALSKQVWLAYGLTEEEYNVIWEEGTERPGTSELNDETRKGKYVTKVCGLEVFSSEHKYESGTGWPSFYEANKDNIVLKEDYSWLGIKRIEIESKCGEHLGHVFEDGPDPTGLRYCMNGASLVFVPDEE
jgi:peptide-methionine (R)-S-oxide reductase